LGTGPLRIEIKRSAHGHGLPVPAMATAGSAGCDLAAAVEDEVVLEPGQRELIPTGFSIAVPEGYEAQVRPRSGLALKHGIVLPNSPGTIDSDYRGELKVIVMNAGSESFAIRRGDRIAQLVVAPVVQVQWCEVECLDETHRGAGGFGHTGNQGRAGQPRAKRVNSLEPSG